MNNDNIAYCIRCKESLHKYEETGVIVASLYNSKGCKKVDKYILCAACFYAISESIKGDSLYPY